MVKKLLILRSAEIFFPQGPNIYKYLSDKLEKSENFDFLNAMYENKKNKGPLLFAETINAVLNREKIEKLIELFIIYIKKFLNPDLKDFLKKVKSKNYEIAFFSSYPRIFFMEANCWLEYGINYIYGIVDEFDEEGKIIGIKLLKFQNEKFIRREMEKLGFTKEFTIEPNKYGMLELLIKLMKEKKFSRENTVLIGNSAAAKLQMKLAGKVIREFDDLSEVLKKL